MIEYIIQYEDESTVLFVSIFRQTQNEMCLLHLTLGLKVLVLANTLQLANAGI